MSRTVALNALFLVAGYTSSFASEVLYKLALGAIVVILHTLWIRSIVRRAVKLENQRTLQSVADTLI